MNANFLKTLGFRAAGLLAGVLLLGAGTGVPDVRGDEPAAQAEKETPPPAADPKAIWPAGLEKLAGRYVFVQVASPGGLWDDYQEEGKMMSLRRQVSINELPASLKDRLTRAEIVISDLTLPSDVEAMERESPSKRGKLRFYEETTKGRLVLKNLPGIGSEGMDRGEYTGPALFTLEHQGHSNPSVVGVLNQRQQQESTWGAATLDFATLEATPLNANGEPGEETPSVIGNARILRSGIEIFAFVEWREKDKRGEHHYTGSVRLLKKTEG